MNKISFRDLIDLEPKPKKVKYDGLCYEYDGEDYLVEDGRFLNENHKWVMKSFLENNMSFINMNKQLIEIIEKDNKIGKLNEIEFIGSRCDEMMSKKINELIEEVNNLKGE